MSRERFRTFDHLAEISTTDPGWTFRAHELPNGSGIHTQLCFDWSLGAGISLDWGDILSHPMEATIHMYAHAPDNVALSLKRKRMETMQAAILVFDGMMIDLEIPLTVPDTLKLLKQEKLPRPLHVFMRTESPSLLARIDLADTEQQPKAAFGHIIKWNTLVRYAAAGAIVRPKKFLKKQVQEDQ